VAAVTPTAAATVGASIGPISGSWGYVGADLSHWPIPIANTRMTRSTRPTRYGNFSYRFDVPNGAYDVPLQLCRVYWNAVGKTVFGRVHRRRGWSRITMTFTLTSAMMSLWLCRSSIVG